MNEKKMKELLETLAMLDMIPNSIGIINQIEHTPMAPLGQDHKRLANDINKAFDVTYSAAAKTLSGLFTENELDLINQYFLNPKLVGAMSKFSDVMPAIHATISREIHRPNQSVSANKKAN